MPNSCDSRRQAGITLSTTADPDPWQAGNGCTHQVEIDNQRPGNIYQVEIFARALQANHLTFDGAPDVFWSESVIRSQSSRSFRAALAAEAGIANTTVEVETSVAFYDATQRVRDEDEAAYSGEVEAMSNLYALDIP